MAVFKFYLKITLIFCISLISLQSQAFTLDSGKPQPLPVDQAFAFSLEVPHPGMLQAHWDIHSGYYLYRDRFQFSILTPQKTQLTPEDWPRATHRKNAILGEYLTDGGNLILTFPLTEQRPFTLQIQYQGCSEQQFCYPPQTRTFSVDLATHTIQALTLEQRVAEQPSQTSTLFSKLTILLGFLGFGLLLAFTPCVLPLLPILSGIILGHSAHLKTKRAFLLSSTYVLGMAFTYTLAGILFAVLGLSVQSYLQTPWVLGSLSALFIILALCLLLNYDLRLPQSWTAKINSLSKQQARGQFWGVALMGAFSALIVSPCVSAPLVGALAYISQKHDVFLGGAALFCLSLGMGLPLILFNTFGAHYLPKTGPWMNTLKKYFGFMFLALSIWLLSRLLPGALILFLWGVLALWGSYHFKIFNWNSKSPGLFFRLQQTLGSVLAIYGILMIVGASLGHTNPWLPLKKSLYTQSVQFKTVRSTAELNQAIAEGSQAFTLLDFYADWCVSCHELERNFQDPQLKNTLAQFNLIRVDLTHPSTDITLLQKNWNVIAPPTLIIVNAQGEEVGDRIIGAVDVETLKHDLSLAK